MGLIVSVGQVGAWQWAWCNMSEAETYARMDKAYRTLRASKMTISANILKEAMDEYASDYNDRTSQDLPSLAKEYIF